jgi:hypothetical protein
MPKLSSKKKGSFKKKGISLKKKKGQSFKKKKGHTKLSGKNNKNISMGKLARAFSVANQGEALLRIIKRILNSSKNIDKKLKKELGRLPLFKGIQNRDDVSEKLLQMAQDFGKERSEELQKCSIKQSGYRETQEFYNNLITEFDYLGMEAMDTSTNSTNNSN